MFVVECTPEVTLVTSLTSVSRRKVDHVGGRSRVVRKLVRNYKNSTGIVDEDPNRVHSHYMQRFGEIEFLRRERFRILHHNRRNNRLIVICPRLEDWIIEASREANIDLNRFNLPNDPLEMHEIINIRIERFQRLVEELKVRSNRVKALRNYLTRASI
jgi:hypothetical protein